MTIRIWNSLSLRSVLVAAALSAAVVACGDGADESANDEPTVAAQVSAPRPGAGNASTTRCAVQYTECLLGAWDDVLTPRGLSPITKCTAEAEKCGLFDNAPDAGTSVDLTPSCGMEVADCYLKNPRNLAKCQELPCRKSGSSASTTP